MAGIEDNITLITSPPADWMPVFQPILYVFEVDGPVLFTYPTLIVTIEVSHNGIDFTAPIVLTAAISQPIGSLSRFTVNPAPHLAALFSVGYPVEGTDTQLFKLYRLKVGRSNDYDGTGTPEITTDPAYCAYAVDLPVLGLPAYTALTSSPIEGYNPDFLGVFTFITGEGDSITNEFTAPPDVPVLPCTKYPKHMYWLNRFGGWQAWVFDGKHEYEDEVIEGVTWIDAAGATHTASVGPVQHKCSVKSGFVSKSVYDTIAGIRHAIKVYHKDGEEWREVNVERGSYARYKEGDKRREVNFTFTYANPTTIQQA